MNKKAFTLVEIMGVIIIIGIITLITTPIVSYIIEEMRIGAFRSGLHGVFRTTEYYYKQNSFEEFPSMGLEVTSEKVELKNKKFVSGKVVKDKEGNLYLRNVTDNRYCGNGIITNLRITKGDCSDLTVPENLSITVLEEGINKIKVSGYYEEDGYIRRIEFGIREKGNGEYVWHESIKDGIPHNIYEFIGLKKNTEYEIGLKVTNENDLSSEEYTEAKTLNIENPYITYKKEWEKSKEISINIPSVESSLKYSYILVDSEGIVEETEINQSDINNHIYKVTINKENETMIIKVIDESNSSNNYTSIGEVIGYIDITNPTIEITSTSTPTGSNNWYINSPVITITKSDSKSGLKSYQYMISEDGGSTYNGVTTIEDVMNISTLVINKNGSNIKVRIRVIDNVGNNSEYVYTDVLKIDIGSITAPVITGGSESWSSTNRTISVSTASTSPSGIAKYQYYLSTSSTSQTGGSWLDVSGISQVLSTNGTYYVFFRGVSNSGKTSSVSNAQQVRIDNITPTITAKASEYTIIQGTSNALPSTYFNVSTTGASGIASTVCKVGSATYTNTSSMPVGTHTLTCTTTSGAGKSASASTKVIVISSSDVNKEIPYSGEEQTYTVPVDGVYQLEVWGAQGGSTPYHIGGKGGSAKGQTYLTKGTVLYMYIGGTTTSTSGGYNGGGAGGCCLGYGGGGATDIRIYGTAFENRIIVAGGGGGASQGGVGGSGGGINGVDGKESDDSQAGYGATQTSPGCGRKCGSFGKGASSTGSSTAGGGGGYYGGGGSGSWSGGGGGSGYAGNLSSVSMSTGVQIGNGRAKITYVTSIRGSVTIPKSSTAIFSYTGSVQTYTVPSNGTYRLEVWGAQGGNNSTEKIGGKGGYAQGQITLTKGTVLNIYVGGTTTSTSGGYNGGGAGGCCLGYGGGGATDIRINGTAFENRIIVAGGGGGASNGGGGGAGGGINGVNGKESDDSQAGYGATQSGPGCGRKCGSLGVGATSTGSSTAGGGGGYYGGGGSGSWSGGGGGSGYTGSLTNSYNIAGNLTTVPNFVGGYMTGKEGNGYAAITRMS